MISDTYDHRCETLRFVSRHTPFVFAGFGRIGVGSETIEMPPTELRCVRSQRLPVAHRVAWASVKKLRKRAVKRLKSLARVNLCAGKGLGAAGL
jgi:hypothetical protein